MTPIKIPETLRPDVGVMHGYNGGMALYVADWKSVMMCFRLQSNDIITKIHPTNNN